MKSASAGLIAHLAGNNRTYVADLVTLELTQYLGVDAAHGVTMDGTTGNTTCKWTTGDTDLNGFSCAGPPLKRGSVRQAAGVEISTMDLELTGPDWLFPNGQSLPLAAMRGAFDGAHVKVERLFMATWGDLSLGTLHWFEGSVSAMDPSSLSLKLVFKSDLEKLNIPIPRRLFQPGCPYALFDAGCGVAKTINVRYWTGTVAAAPTPTASAIPFTGTAATDAYKLGAVTFTSGALKNMTRSISSDADSGASHVIQTTVPFPSAPAVGDTFIYSVGCDKTFAMCVSRFANGNRFGGFPFVPKPESIR